MEHGRQFAEQQSERDAMTKFVRDRLEAHPDVAEAHVEVDHNFGYSIRVYHHDHSGSSFHWAANVPQGVGVHAPGEIKNVFVSPEHRRKGVASAMQDTATSLSRAFGLMEPKRSQIRSEEGVAWGDAYDRKRGIGVTKGGGSAWVW